MSEIVHTSIYGERNFTVIKFLLTASKFGCIAFAPTEDKGVKYIKVATYANEQLFCNVVVTPDNEVILYHPDTMIHTGKLPTVKSLQMKLSTLIKNLKEVFTDKDEFYLSSLMYMLENDMINYLYNRDVTRYSECTFDWSKNLQSPEYYKFTLCYGPDRMIYFKDEIPMKIADFENALKELKHPTYNGKFVDAFKIEQNKFVMKNLIDVMSDYFYHDNTINGVSPIYALYRKASTNRIFVQPNLSRIMKKWLLYVANEYMLSQYFKDDLTECMNSDRFNEVISGFEFIENTDLPHIGHIYTYRKVYYELFS